MRHTIIDVAFQALPYDWWPGLSFMRLTGALALPYISPRILFESCDVLSLSLRAEACSVRDEQKTLMAKCRSLTRKLRDNRGLFERWLWDCAQASRRSD